MIVCTLQRRGCSLPLLSSLPSVISWSIRYKRLLQFLFNWNCSSLFAGVPRGVRFPEKTVGFCDFSTFLLSGDRLLQGSADGSHVEAILRLQADKIKNTVAAAGVFLPFFQDPVKGCSGNPVEPA